MFFNMDTGEHNGKDISCWLADGNLWISGHGVETSISSFPVEAFCSFIETNAMIEEYSDTEVDDISIVLETLDEGTKNLCLSEGKFFIAVNMKVEHIVLLAEFLRKHNSEAQKQS